MVKPRTRPRAQRKGRSQEQTSDGQVMVKLRMRPRAQRKGRSLEQLSNGQVMVSTVGDPRPTQGQVAGTAEK